MLDLLRKLLEPIKCTDSFSHLIFWCSLFYSGIIHQGYYLPPPFPATHETDFITSPPDCHFPMCLQCLHCLCISCHKNTNSMRFFLGHIFCKTLEYGFEVVQTINLVNLFCYKVDRPMAVFQILSSSLTFFFLKNDVILFFVVYLLHFVQYCRQRLILVGLMGIDIQVLSGECGHLQNVFNPYSVQIISTSRKVSLSSLPL